MTDDDPRSDRIRLSDAERERAAQRLQQAFAEGRISVTELDERIGAVYAAQYPDDLRPPLADLPGAAELTTRIPTTPAAASPAAPGGPTVLSTTSGHLKRVGRWILPAELVVEVRSGHALLDCTQADVVSSPVTITATVQSGSVVVILPEGATANIDGVRARSGTVRSKMPAVPVPGALHLVVQGEVGSGRLVVRGPRKKWFGRAGGSGSAGA